MCKQSSQKKTHKRHTQTNENRAKCQSSKMSPRFTDLNPTQKNSSNPTPKTSNSVHKKPKPRPFKNWVVRSPWWAVIFAVWITIFPVLNDGSQRVISTRWGVGTCTNQNKKTRWWFQIFFIFTPIWGRFQFWLIFFRPGWNHQPEKIFKKQQPKKFPFGGSSTVGCSDGSYCRSGSSSGRLTIFFSPKLMFWGTLVSPIYRKSTKKTCDHLWSLR